MNVKIQANRFDFEVCVETIEDAKIKIEEYIESVGVHPDDYRYHVVFTDPTYSGFWTVEVEAVYDSTYAEHRRRREGAT